MMRMTRIIDNEKEKLDETLNRELKDAKELAFASAYFNVSGFGLLKDAISGKPMKFLLGRPPNESVAFEDEIVRELEEQEDDPRYYNLMNEAVKYFSDPAREIRKIDGPFFHGKAYIGVSPSVDDPQTGVAVVGSSNFTYAGLRTNAELNVENTDRELLKGISEWFMGKWNEASSHKDEFLSFLRNYTVAHTPYEVAAKALYEYYRRDIDAAERTSMMDLKTFQVVSVMEGNRILGEWNGVVVADSTGLGKTRTMIALAHEARREGKKVLLIAPKSVLDTTWKHEMEITDTFINHVNSEYISANPDDFAEKYGAKGYNFIVVDEAHYFKSSASNRYKALRDLIVRNGVQIVLATATPINNSLMDLYNLISLYAPDDSIKDITGGTLKGYFTENQKELIRGKNVEMSGVLERFVVRHSRKFAKLADPSISFPERILDMDTLNRYVPNVDYKSMFDILENVRFAPYEMAVDRLTDLKLPSGERISEFAEAEKKENLKEMVRTIVILNMFKRLESSHKAFLDTVSSLASYLKDVIEFAGKSGYFLPRSVSRDPLFDIDEEIPEGIFEKDKYEQLREKCKLSDQEKEELVRLCSEDILLLEKLTGMVTLKDPKAESFLGRIRKLHASIEKPNGIIVFTQYTSTAQMIYEFLAKEFNGECLLTTGTVTKDRQGRNSDVSTIVDYFQGNGGILVSTDVLSEGQNLQNAQYVVNYDFPWNPVILIQRAGRIDRMGSSYDKVYLINMLQNDGNPDSPESLEHFIGLMKKLYRKIGSIKAAIGIDAPILGEDASPLDFGTIQRLISAGDGTVLAKLAEEIEQFSNDPKDRLMEMIGEMGEETIKGLPNGIGAIKQYEREGVFSLFTDGMNYHWRMKFEDEPMITEVNKIISILVKDRKVDVSDEKIEYGQLIGRLKELKESTISSLEKVKSKKATQSIAPPMSPQAKEVFRRLSEEDEDAALVFRSTLTTQEAVVKSLYDSRDGTDFMMKAREIIASRSGGSLKEREGNGGVKLKRVCWCWLRKMEKSDVSPI